MSFSHGPDKAFELMTYIDYLATMQRDDQSIDGNELISAYDRQIDELRAAVANMSREQILARPIPGKWSSLELVCHLADTEIYFTDRIERTIALERPLLIGVDERPYPEKLHYQALDLEEQLNLFAALRRHAARILRGQTPEIWERKAVHSETGMVTLRQLVLQAVRHVNHHLKFLAEKRQALGLAN